MFLYEVKPPYLYVGFLYSPILISEFLRLYSGERILTFDGIPHNEIIAPLPVTDLVDYPNRLTLCVQKGTLDQGINPIIAADFPEFGEHFMVPGVANAVFKCHYGDDSDEFLALWGNVQIPNFQWVGRGVPLADPRIPGCRLDFDPRDPEDLFNALATWPYSDNAALAQNFWAMMPFGLNATPARTLGGDTSREVLKASADFDDELVPLKDGGYQKRHVVSGIASLSDKPNVVMEALQTANRGYASQRAGEFIVYSSQPLEPVMTITDSMLVGGFEFRNIKPKKELVNVARCKFVAPDREYQDAEGPVLRRDDLVSSDGETFEQSVRLSFTPTHQRAQRLLKGFVSEARLGKFLNLRLSMKAYGLREGMVVRRFSETGRYTVQDGLYTIEEWQMSEDRSSVSFALAEYDPAISRDWNTDADEQPFVMDDAA